MHIRLEHKSLNYENISFPIILSQPTNRNYLPTLTYIV